MGDPYLPLLFVFGRWNAINPGFIPFPRLLSKGHPDILAPSAPTVCGMLTGSAVLWPVSVVLSRTNILEHQVRHFAREH